MGSVVSKQDADQAIRLSYEDASKALRTIGVGGATIQCVAGDLITITISRSVDIGSYSLNSAPSSTHAMFTRVGL